MRDREDEPEEDREAVAAKIVLDDELNRVLRCSCGAICMAYPSAYTPNVAIDKETAERIDQPVAEEAERETRLTPAEAVERMRINVPVRGNRKLRALIERVNEDKKLKAWWHVSNVNAVARMEINDHSWVHIQIVTNIALKLLRQLTKHHVEPSVVRDFGMTRDDAEVVVTLAALTALRRDVDPPARSRGLQPLPRRAEAARAARRDLRRARPHRDRVGGAAGDHQPSRRRAAADDRGGPDPRRRRARHGEGPLAHPVRARPRLDALAVRGGDRGRRRSATARSARS